MSEISNWIKTRGAVGRWRRELRRRLLEPVLVGGRTFRETVLNALSARGHLVYCRNADGCFFVDPSDRVIGSWLMWHGRWQREEIEAAIAALQQAGRLSAAPVFVDAGANIGTHTVYALRGGPFARAVSIEPEPRNAELLRMNVAANGLQDRVTVIEAALGAEQCQAVLTLHPRNKGAHTLGAAPSVDSTQCIEVPVLRLDRVLENLGVSQAQVGLVWIDVEGAERDVVAGLGAWLGRVPLALEYDPGRPDPQAAAELRTMLERYYTRMLRLGPQDARPEPIERLAAVVGINDVLVF